MENIRLITTEEDRLQMSDVFLSRDKLQYKDVPRKSIEFMAQQIIRDSYILGAKFYGYFDIYDKLMGFIQFNEWLGYPGQYSMGFYATSANYTYERTIDGKNADIRFYLTNKAVEDFEADGFDTLWTLTPNVSTGLVRPSSSPYCKLYNYTRTIEEIVPAGFYIPVNEYIGGDYLKPYIKRPDPRSYLLPYPALTEQQIVKMKKPEVII